MHTNSPLPDSRDEAEIERLEQIICGLREAMREASDHAKQDRPMATCLILEEALERLNPSNRES
jgi:hypothetical protein